MLRATRSRRILITTDAVGGVWSYALDLARGLSTADIETVLAVLGPMPDEAQSADAQAIPGLRLVETGIPLDWDAKVDATGLSRAGADLADLGADIRADIIHLNSPALAAHVGFSAPVVGGCHSCLGTWWDAVKRPTRLPADFAWRAARVGEGYRRCRILVAPSHAFAGATAALHQLDRTPIVVYNGRRHRAPDTLPTIGQAQAAIFTAGRLWDEGKNLAALDRAGALIDTPIHAAGPLAAPDGHRVAFDHLTTLGRLSEDQVACWLATKPIFISTARYEPFGLAVLEAARAGCPLVLSDIPTFRELWNGVARFVPAGDERAIAAALQELLSLPAERRRRGAAAAAQARRYSVAKMTQRMLRIYADMTGAPRFGRDSQQAVA